MSRTYRKNSYNKCALRKPHSTNEKRQLDGILHDEDFRHLNIAKVNRMRSRVGGSGDLPSAWDDIVTSSHYQNDHN
jgi:hypothetical protein